MRFCSECNLYFEDSVDICSSCGEKLDPVNTSSVNTEIKRTDVVRETIVRERVESNPVFMQGTGRNIRINGTVREINSQEISQSKFAKFVRAAFFDEPYQLGEKSVVTILRVEEFATTYGVPLHARDITIYGSVMGILALGDDVTIETKSRNGRLIAKKIFNHSVDADIRLKYSVSSKIIKSFLIALLFCVAILIFGLVTADYNAIGLAITNTVSSLLPTLALGGTAYYYVKKKLKR